MARSRVGVVLLVPSPIDREIDALRRAVGDGTYERVPAHLTLVPPVNVHEDRFDDAIRDYGAAYELSRDPALFFKIGRANERAGKCEVAVSYYRRYLRQGHWPVKGDYPLTPSLRDRTAGILGMGRIGKAIAMR